MSSWSRKLAKSLNQFKKLIKGDLEK